MYCEPFKCYMTEAACRSNVDLAISAIKAVDSGEQSIFQLPEQAVNRLLICGYCPKSGIAPARAKAAFRKSVSTLIDKLEWYTMEDVHSASRTRIKLDKKRAYREAQKARRVELDRELQTIVGGNSEGKR